MLSPMALRGQGLRMNSGPTRQTDLLLTAIAPVIWGSTYVVTCTRLRSKKIM